MYFPVMPPAMEEAAARHLEGAPAPPAPAPELDQAAFEPPMSGAAKAMRLITEGLRDLLPSFPGLHARVFGPEHVAVAGKRRLRQDALRDAAPA